MNIHIRTEWSDSLSAFLCSSQALACQSADLSQIHQNHPAHQEISGSQSVKIECASSHRFISGEGCKKIQFNGIKTKHKHVTCTMWREIDVIQRNASPRCYVGNCYFVGRDFPIRQSSLGGIPAVPLHMWSVTS